MRLPFRKKSKKSQDTLPDGDWGLHDSAGIVNYRDGDLCFPPSARSAKLLALLPAAVLERIFGFVCMHANDESYEAHESSVSVGGGGVGSGHPGCMLCDTRDLAHCSRVNYAWHESAIKVLYHSVRIDQVHYCSREAILAEKRKQTHRFDKNGTPEDPARARLRLFRRTVREDPTRIGRNVLFLKIPYMLREYCHVELAQTIAVLPNLKYIDLPEGMSANEPSYATLRLEVQARCPDLRKMAYHAGSEASFEALAAGRAWRRLEVLELSGIDVGATTMRSVLRSLASLRAIKVARTESLSDEVLSSSAYGPPLPALEEIVLEDTPRVTAAGLMEYLAWPETQRTLKVLSLSNTGVRPAALPELLPMASSLRTLAIQCKIAEPLPSDGSVARLSAPALEHLRYEIAGQSDSIAYETIRGSYYSHLASSIIAGGFPRMTRLYVLDNSFPDRLSVPLLLPPPRAFAAVSLGPGPNRDSGRGHRHGHGHDRSSSTQSLGPPEIELLAPPCHNERPKRSSAMAATTKTTFTTTTTNNYNNNKSNSNTNTPFVAPNNRFSSNNPFAAAAAAAELAAAQAEAASDNHGPELEIYTKSDLVGKWNFARMDAFSTMDAVGARGLADARRVGTGAADGAKDGKGAGGGGGGGGGGAAAAAGRHSRRPSSYGLAADVAGTDWHGGEARRSIMIPDGSGLFLPVPGVEDVPCLPRMSVSSMRKQAWG